MAATRGNKELFRQVVDALNERDFDAFADTHAEDVLLDDNGEEYRGIEAAAEHERALYEAFPDMTYSPETVLAEDDVIAALWTVTGTHEAAFRGIEPTGEAFEFPATGVMEVDDREITSVWLTYDRLGLLEQLGVVDPPTG